MAHHEFAGSFEKLAAAVQEVITTTHAGLQEETPLMEALIQEAEKMWQAYRTYHARLPTQARNLALFQAEDMAHSAQRDLQALLTLNTLRREQLSMLAQTVLTVNPPYRESALLQIREVEKELDRLLDLARRLDRTHDDYVAQLRNA